MSVLVWVGVDPGHKDTGIVLRHGPNLISHHIVSRTSSEDLYPGRGVGVGPLYLQAVIEQVDRFMAIGRASELTGAGGVRVAVEGLGRPSSHIGGKPMMLDPATLIGAGMVLGAVLSEWPDAVVVPPGKHGGNLLLTYPAALVTPGEKRLGLNRPAGDSADIRHCRSAWDIAGAGPGTLRVRDAAAAKKSA